MCSFVSVFLFTLWISHEKPSNKSTYSLPFYVINSLNQLVKVFFYILFSASEGGKPILYVKGIVCNEKEGKVMKVG
jgi:hypothetical protein